MFNLSILSQLVPQFLSAAELTFFIGITGIVASVAIGIIVEAVRFFKVPVLGGVLRIYCEVARNTPLIIQLFFLYFALPKLGLNLSAETCAIGGLAFLGGAYMASAIEAGVGQIGRGQIEAASAIGLSRFEIFKMFIVPLGFKFAAAGIFANFVFLFKETSVFSAIAVTDLMNVAKDVIGLTYDTNESLLLLVISYFAILLPFVIVYLFLQKRVKKAEGK